MSETAIELISSVAEVLILFVVAALAALTGIKLRNLVDKKKEKKLSMAAAAAAAAGDETAQVAENTDTAQS